MIASGTSTAFSPSFLAYCVLRFLSGMAMTGIIITSLCLSEYPCGAPAAPLTAVRPRGAGVGGHFSYPVWASVSPSVIRGDNDRTSLISHIFIE